MRIAYLVPSLGLQEGQGRANLELLRRVARAGHEIDVYTSYAREMVAAIPGVRVKRIPRLPSWQFGNQLLQIASTARLRRARYEIVHADAGVTARGADVVTCHTVTDRWLRLPREIWHEPGLRGLNQAVATRFKARLEIRQCRAARAVLANSQMTAGDLAARGVDPSRITVIPFGVDADHYRPPSSAERAEARAAFGIAPDAFVVAFVGSHGPRKGLPEALDAVAVAEAGEVLLVAGQHRGGEWARAAASRRLPVLMPGKLADVRRAYWASDALAYPSRYDAFGMAVLEAMACGLPAVVSRASGSYEIVGDAGIVIGDSSARALREALDTIRRDPARRTAMGDRARAIAVERDWDIPGAILLDRYASLAEGEGRRRTTAA